MENAVSIYNQRYETWRHLDKIRYQLIQLSIAICSASALTIKVSEGAVPAWLLFTLSVVSLALWKVMSKVNWGIVKNGQALKTYGAAIGDDLLPEVADRDRSVFFYIELAYLAIGLALLIWGVATATAAP